MSSDLYFYDTPFYHNSSPSSYGDLSLSDPFSPFCDLSADIFSEFSNNQIHQNPVKNFPTSHNLTPNFLSSSPPSHQLENLSLHSSTHLQQQQPIANGYSNLSVLDGLGVKTEECQMGFENFDSFFMPHSYSGVENVSKMMQRSHSSNFFEGKVPDFHFQPNFDALLESSNALNPPEGTFLSGQMRRVCSTGDLQNITTSHSTQISSSTESSSMEDGNVKVGRYSAEERKDRISKYRAKRNQRKFTKTIKYACRKTLADNRPRIRGRFARNDETGEIAKAACSIRQEDEDVIWFDGLHGAEDGGGNRRRGDSVNSYGQPQFQYYSY